jgi:hypothetical protein
MIMIKDYDYEEEDEAVEGSGFLGRVKWKVAPFGISLLTQVSPPCA